MTTSPLPERNVGPRFRTKPEAVSSSGLEAVALAKDAGLILDPWQEAALVDSLAERTDGRWASLEVGLIVPRQNGKGSVLEARELAGLFLFGERLILHSAHEFKTAAEAFRRLLFLIESNADLERHVARVARSHGDEGIELKNGQRIRFVARSTGSGRGFSGDLVVLDEAYNISPDALAALFPTLSARPNPQIWYTSSAPLQAEKSDVLRAFCKRGREGSSGLCYIEYSADLAADQADPDVWAYANPALGIRISEEFVRLERDALGAEFARERLGHWIEDDGFGLVISRADWSACEDAKSGPDGPVSFGLGVSEDRNWAAFAVSAASPRGGTHVEVVDYQPGTDWVVGRAVELQAKWGGRFALGASTPAASLKGALEAAGVAVVEVSNREHADACGTFFDAVMQRQVRHLGQPSLTVAVDGADRRFSGDAWLWSQRASTTDISPLVAVTLASWLHDQPAVSDLFVAWG